MCPHDAYLDAEDCTRCMDPEQLRVVDGMLTLRREGKPCLPVSCPEVEEETIVFTLLGVPEGEQGVRLSEPDQE